MGLFDFFKRKKISQEDQAVIDNFRTTVEARLNALPPKPLTREEYSEIRKSERQWFEDHYDFSTIEAIEAIPERKDLPRPPGRSPTGDVYYYLKYKARLHEKNGNIALALACMRKSITLMRLRYGEWSGHEECETYVRMLFRHGYKEEAIAEQQRIDAYYAGSLDRMRLQNFQSVCRQAESLETDLVMMTVTGSTCSECARYQGRVYSLSGKDKNFPPLPDLIKKNGTVHPDCHHSFSPYIHKVTRVDMSYILQVHPLKNPKYSKNIIAFSNRPFEDDRTDECIEAAEVARERRRIRKQNESRRDEIILERIERQQSDYADYDWLKEHFPEKCPASATGYRRMKTQNTKNYQTLKRLASELGREI